MHLANVIVAANFFNEYCEAHPPSTKGSSMSCAGHEFSSMQCRQMLVGAGSLVMAKMEVTERRGDPLVDTLLV